MVGVLPALPSLRDAIAQSRTRSWVLWHVCRRMVVRWRAVLLYKTIFNLPLRFVWYHIINVLNITPYWEVIMKKLATILMLSILPMGFAFASTSKAHYGKLYIILPSHVKIRASDIHITGSSYCSAQVTPQNTLYGVLISSCKANALNFNKNGTASWTTTFQTHNNVTNQTSGVFSIQIKCDYSSHKVGEFKPNTKINHCDMHLYSAPPNSSITVRNSANDNGAIGDNGYFKLYYAEK